MAPPINENDREPYAPLEDPPAPAVPDDQSVQVDDHELYSPLEDPPPLAVLDDQPSEIGDHHETELPTKEQARAKNPENERPKTTAIETAEWDLRAYKFQWFRYHRQAKRYTLASIAVSTFIATLGVLTAVLDQALVGIAIGLLGVVLSFVEALQGRSKAESRAAAYRVAHVELTGELDFFRNDAGAYALISQQYPADHERRSAARRTQLVERLTEINRNAENSTA